MCSVITMTMTSILITRTPNAQFARKDILHILKGPSLNLPKWQFPTKRKNHSIHNLHVWRRNTSGLGCHTDHLNLPRSRSGNVSNWTSSYSSSDTSSGNQGCTAQTGRIRVTLKVYWSTLDTTPLRNTGGGKMYKSNPVKSMLKVSL